MNNQQVFDLLKLIWPLIVLQLAVQIYAIVDILSKKKARNLSVPVWIVIIALTEIVGPIVYFVYGRSEE